MRATATLYKFFWDTVHAPHCTVTYPGEYVGGTFAITAEAWTGDEAPYGIAKTKSVTFEITDGENTWNVDGQFDRWTADRKEKWKANFDSVNAGIKTAECKIKATAANYAGLTGAFETASFVINNEPGVLFFDDFSGDLSAWSIQGTAQIEEGVLHVYPESAAGVKAGTEWTDYKAETTGKIKDSRDWSCLLVRLDPVALRGYSMGFNNHNIRIWKWVEGSPIELWDEPRDHELDIWYKLKIVCCGDKIDFYENEILIYSYVDPEPSLQGTVVVASNGPDTDGYFDDVKVSESGYGDESIGCSLGIVSFAGGSVTDPTGSEVIVPPWSSGKRNYNQYCGRKQR